MTRWKWFKWFLANAWDSHKEQHKWMIQAIPDVAVMMYMVYGLIVFALVVSAVVLIM